MVQTLNRGKGHSMVAAPILEDLRRDLSEFGKACVEFCSRESHVVAHVLARWGRENHPSVWFESPPEFSIKFLIGGVDVI